MGANCNQADNDGPIEVTESENGRPCDANPCVNGQCFDNGDADFVCSCPDGFTKKTCNKASQVSAAKSTVLGGAMAMVALLLG